MSGVSLRRRKVVSLLGGAAAALALPRAARAQPPVIGFLHPAFARTIAPLLAGFREGLRETGIAENRNVTIEYRWGEGQDARLPALAADLVRRQVAVIATGGGLTAAFAAKSATVTIPIVFSGGSDPVAAGLVASLNKPGGNITGVLNFAAELTAKRLELLRELVPTAMVIAVLYNPENAEAGLQLREMEIAARAMGVQLELAGATPKADLAAMMATLVQSQAKALFIANEPSFSARRYQLATLIAQYRIPAMHPQRQYTEAGGLMSYGANFPELYRQAGNYVGRILKGEKPADLPVVQPARFEFVINLQTAKAQGLDMPAKLLALADEVIE
jgi:putative ABC transport system substrate-binding protein